MATLKFTFKVASVLADATSAVLADPSGTFGIRRTDTEEVVVAADTAMAKTATGTYEYDFSADIANVEYQFYVKCEYGGETHYFETIYTASGVPDVITEGRTMPSEVVAKYSTDTANLFSKPSDNTDWPLYIGYMPDKKGTPVNCAAIFNTPGIFDGKDMRENIDQHFGVEILVRALTETSGYDKMADIEEDFKEVKNVNISVVSGEIWKLQNLHQTSSITMLGLDENRRFMFSINFAVSMKLQ
ncbi:MAG: minor capsid protein [Candidatus Neomarinimicrobiota bacterium]|jgi:hypothetical protein|nr:minor capsid protein [bacterium]